MPKIVDHEKYRKELLSKCFDLFAEKGYASLTMREIADALGVSTGTLYHYFENKEDLFEKLASELATQVMSGLMQIVPKRNTLEERLEMLFEFVENTEERMVKILLIMVDYFRTHRMSESDTNEVFYEEQVRQMKWTGEYLEIDDPDLVRFIVIFVGGIVAQRFLDGNKTEMKSQLTLLKHMILTYVNQSKLHD